MAGIILHPNRNKMPKMPRTRVSFTKGKSPTPLAKVGKHQPSSKMLIVLGFWEGDRGQAMTLARLLADLEPAHSELADFLFVARFDCEQDPPTVEAVSRKFNVYTHISQKRMVGWPMGCNGIFFGAMEWCYSQMAAGRVPGYKFIFNTGPDACPLQKGWVERLHREFDAMNTGKQVCVSGCLLEHGGRKHINGDAILLTGEMTFLKWLALQAAGMHAKAGWDWYLASQFENWGWENLPCIKSVWNRNVPFLEHDWYNEVESNRTVYFHGQKGFSLLDLARQKLLT